LPLLCEVKNKQRDYRLAVWRIGKCLPQINMKPDNVFYQRLQPDFLAGFLAAFFLVDRLAGLRALFFALRAVFFLRVAMIPPSGMLGIIIGEKCQMYARDFGESFFAAKRV